jgi:hypothetical protein
MYKLPYSFGKTGLRKTNVKVIIIVESDITETGLIVKLCTVKECNSAQVIIHLIFLIPVCLSRLVYFKHLIYVLGQGVGNCFGSGATLWKRRLAEGRTF